MNESKKPTVSLAPNGPYIIKNLSRFTNKNGDIKTEETMALCRCGQSANKPFCDGAHVKINFSSENNETHLENKCDSYAGQKITVYDNRSICAHAGVCTDKLATVFRMKQEPWIDADGASMEEVISVIEQCPSGALSYTLSETKKTEPQMLAGVYIAPNGPYVVSGCPDLLNANWREGASPLQYTLCRCGASKNKPYCDGSHWSANFIDDEN